MKTRLILAFVLGVLGTLAETKLSHPAPVKAFALVDPLYIVHQTSPGGPISVYRTNDPAVAAIVASVPDGGKSPDGDTTYIVGTPYLTTATQALENSLYIGK